VLPIIRVKSVEQAVEHVNANRLALQVCVRGRGGGEHWKALASTLW
jgi:acyl-CoA reductase-like NAD-dependent aldehyde dehydrogenase